MKHSKIVFETMFNDANPDNEPMISMQTINRYLHCFGQLANAIEGRFKFKQGEHLVWRLTFYGNKHDSMESESISWYQEMTARVSLVSSTTGEMISHFGKDVKFNDYLGKTFNDTGFAVEGTRSFTKDPKKIIKRILSCLMRRKRLF